MKKKPVKRTRQSLTLKDVIGRLKELEKRIEELEENMNELWVDDLKARIKQVERELASKLSA